MTTMPMPVQLRRFKRRLKSKRNATARRRHFNLFGRPLEKAPAVPAKAPIEITTPAPVVSVKPVSLRSRLLIGFYKLFNKLFNRGKKS